MSLSHTDASDQVSNEACPLAEPRATYDATAGKGTSP